MKKLLGFYMVFGFCFACNVASAKSNETINVDNHNTDPKTQQEQNKVEKKKPTKYDFSLFRFLTPNSTQKVDSTNLKAKPKNEALKDETVYVKPLSFFKFS